MSAKLSVTRRLASRWWWNWLGFALQFRETTTRLRRERERTLPPGGVRLK